MWLWSLKIELTSGTAVSRSQKIMSELFLFLSHLYLIHSNCTWHLSSVWLWLSIKTKSCSSKIYFHIFLDTIWPGTSWPLLQWSVVCDGGWNINRSLGTISGPRPRKHFTYAIIFKKAKVLPDLETPLEICSGKNADLGNLNSSPVTV